MQTSDPPGGDKPAPPSREDRLAKALRENLKRRKAPPRPPAQPDEDQR